MVYGSFCSKKTESMLYSHVNCDSTTNCNNDMLMINCNSQKAEKVEQNKLLITDIEEQF